LLTDKDKPEPFKHNLLPAYDTELDHDSNGVARCKVLLVTADFNI